MEPAIIICSVRTARNLVLNHLVQTIPCLHPQVQIYLAAQLLFLEADHRRYLAHRPTPIRGAVFLVEAAAQVGPASSEAISQLLQGPLLDKLNSQCLLLPTSHPNRSEGTLLEVAYLVASERAHQKLLQWVLRRLPARRRHHLPLGTRQQLLLDHRHPIRSLSALIPKRSNLIH